MNRDEYQRIADLSQQIYGDDRLEFEAGEYTFEELLQLVQLDAWKSPLWTATKQ